MALLISVEACIRAGTSSLLNSLGARGYTILSEPLFYWESWKGTNPLKEMYTEEGKTLHFQLLALATRARSINNLFLNVTSSGTHRCNVIFVERLAGVSEQIFMQIAKEDGKMTSAEIATINLTIEVMDLPNADSIIYLNTPLDEIERRMQTRARESETQMPPQLNERLRDAHNTQFAANAYILSDNRTVDIDRMLKSYEHRRCKTI